METGTCSLESKSVPDGKKVERIIRLDKKGLEKVPHTRHLVYESAKHEHPFLKIWSKQGLKKDLNKRDAEIYDIEKDITSGNYDWR